MAMAGLDIADPPQALVDWLKPLGIAAGEGKLVDLTLGRRQARDRGRHHRAAAGRRRQRCRDLRRRLLGAVQSRARRRAVAEVRQVGQALRRGADAVGREVAGPADGGRRAGLPSSRVLRRGHGDLPAATRAAARAGTRRADAPGARRARGRPRQRLRRAPRRRFLRRARRAARQGARHPRRQARRRRGDGDRGTGGAENPVARHRPQDRGRRRGARPARRPDRGARRARDGEARQGAQPARQARRTSWSRRWSAGSPR